MANINGVNPPPKGNLNYVQRIIDSFDAVDAHDHTSTKGLQIPTGGIAAAAVTGDKLASSLSGAHSFTGNIVFTAGLATAAVADSSTGNVAALDAASKSLIRMTGAAPVIQGIAAPLTASLLLLMNVTGADFLIKNNDAAATAADRVLTGTGSDFRLKNDALALLQYDNSAQRWRLLGGGGGGSATSSNFTGTSITLSSDTAQIFRYTGGSAQTATFTTTAAVDGAEVMLLGTSDTNTVTIAQSASVLLNGDWVGYRGSTLTLRWDSGLSAMIEVARNGI